MAERAPNIFEQKKALTAQRLEQEHIKRGIKAKKVDGNKLVTRKFMAAMFEGYHNETVAPVLMELVEHMVYQKMWPWSKAKYWYLVFVDWCKKRWQKHERAKYAKRWEKEQKAGMERMTKGRTLEGDG